jgi:hypothetical protein
MFNIEDWRLPAEDFRGKSPAIMADEEQGAPRLERPAGVAAEGERVGQMLDGLEARDQGERAGRERVGSEDVVADQRAHRWIGGFDRGGRGLDTGHVAEPGGEQLLEEGTVARADISRAVTVGKPVDDPREEPAVSAAGEPGLLAAVEIGVAVKGGKLIERRGRVDIEQVAPAALHQPPVHVFGKFSGGESEGVQALQVDVGSGEHARVVA